MAERIYVRPLLTQAEGGRYVQRLLMGLRQRPVHASKHTVNHIILKQHKSPTLRNLTDKYVQIANTQDSGISCRYLGIALVTIVRPSYLHSEL